jgi:SET domain-containing protein
MGLQVKESTLSALGNSSLGLFATRRIPRDTNNILTYEGDVITNRELNRREALGPTDYVMDLDVEAKTYVDARRTNSNPGRYINDCRPYNRRRRECKGNNVEFYYDDDEDENRLRSLRDIAPGEELFFSYGDQYWRERVNNAKRRFSKRIKQMKQVGRVKQVNQQKKRRRRRRY